MDACGVRAILPRPEGRGLPRIPIKTKDFFVFEKGVTLSIPESAKPNLYHRARIVLQSGTLPTMLGATVFLAVTANLYELLCTAGFPMVFTRILP